MRGVVVLLRPERDPAGEVLDARPEAALRRHHVERIRHGRQLVGEPAAGVRRRGIGLELGGQVAEDGASHAERLGDPGAHEVAVGHPAAARDDLAEQLVAEVGVLLLRRHGDPGAELRRARQVRRGIALVDTRGEVGPRRLALEAGLVREQQPQRDRLDGPGRRLRVSDLGQVRDERVVEPERAVVAQLDHGGGGEGLGDRGDAVHRARVRDAARRDVAEAGAAGPHELAVVHDAGRRARQAVLLHERRERALQLACDVVDRAPHGDLLCPRG